MIPIDLYVLHSGYLRDRLKILQVLYNRANKEHNMKRINEIIEEITETVEVISEKEMFDKARKLYPGAKGGLEIEFKNFCKKHKDWKQVIPLLYDAIQKEINHKKLTQERGIFTPSWKGFERWINKRCWEQEFEQLPKVTTSW